MLLTRRPDGTILFEGTWRDFMSEWRAATPADRVVLADGRPAVARRQVEPPNFFTIHGQVWEIVRPRLTAAMQGAPPKKRERLCEVCRTPMGVAREFTDVWSFKCPACRSVQMFGKDVIGGTHGAGEKETR